MEHRSLGNLLGLAVLVTKELMKAGLLTVLFPAWTRSEIVDGEIRRTDEFVTDGVTRVDDFLRLIFTYPLLRPWEGEKRAIDWDSEVDVGFVTAAVLKMIHAESANADGLSQQRSEVFRLLGQVEPRALHELYDQLLQVGHMSLATSTRSVVKEIGGRAWSWLHLGYRFAQRRAKHENRDPEPSLDFQMEDMTFLSGTYVREVEPVVFSFVAESLALELGKLRGEDFERARAFVFIPLPAIILSMTPASEAAMTDWTGVNALAAQIDELAKAYRDA